MLRELHPVETRSMELVDRYLRLTADMGSAFSDFALVMDGTTPFSVAKLESARTRYGIFRYQRSSVIGELKRNAEKLSGISGIPADGVRATIMAIIQHSNAGLVDGVEQMDETLRRLEEYNGQIFAVEFVQSAERQQLEAFSDKMKQKIS